MGRRRVRAATGCPSFFSGALVVRGSGLAEVTATGPRSEIGRIGQSLSGLEGRTETAAAADAQTGGAVRRVRHRHLRAGGVVLYGVLRGDWLEGLFGRYRTRHVDAARGIPGGFDRLHGHGRLAHFQGQCPDPSVDQYRSARFGDGPLHRQDRYADRESHERHRTARLDECRLRAAQSGCGQGPSRYGALRGAGLRTPALRSDGTGLPSLRQATGRHGAR